MGNLLSRFRHRDVRIILLGLDSAGKTTILYRLKLDDLVTTIPTIGFNVESIQYKDLHLTAWDIGSRDKIRPLFRHYYKGADAVVFVIDSHDRERLDELNYDVIKPAIGAEELTNSVFLFLANKIDLPDTMSIEEISDKLGLRFLKHPWGILPVSAISGQGLQAALEWLAVRLGSSQVKPRNFTAAQPPAKLLPECQTSSSLSPSSSNVAAKSDSKPGTKISVPQKPVILVNSKLLMDTKPAVSPSQSSASKDMPAIMTTSAPSSSYAAFLTRKAPGSVLNSFSSYSIAQSMKEDLSRRKFSAISKSDLRKMSCASLMDSSGNRKMSTVSLMDCPNQRKLSSVSLMDSPSRRKVSTTFVIDPMQGKFTSVSFMEAACARKCSGASLTSEARFSDTQNARKFSAASQGEPQTTEAACNRKLSVVSFCESQDEAERPKMSLLSTADVTMTTPPTAKRKPEDLSVGGFGKFSPIMADYTHGDKKDNETSVDAPSLTSPSDHIQPHLRALGLKKSSFMSNSAKYVVNPMDAMKEEHYNEILQLLPERYTNLYSREPYSMASDAPYASSRNQSLLGSFGDTSARMSISVPTDSADNDITSSLERVHISQAGRQTSQDSDSSTSSNNARRSNLDLFCTPTRKSHSDKHSRTHSKHFNPVIDPPSSRAAYCSRAYSAIKCLFFRPTKEQMQQETNSISSDDEKEKGNEEMVNDSSIHTINSDTRADFSRGCHHTSDIEHDATDKAGWHDYSLH